MAQLDTNDGGGGKKKKGGSKQKKVSVHVDFTPMVDMNMLLITFFMLCTSLSKPQTMEIVMPSNKENKQDEAPAVKASQAITILVSGKDKVYYFEGIPKYNDPTSLMPTDYSSKGLRKFLISKNVEAYKKIEELKLDREADKITDDTLKARVSRAKGGKATPVVIIKAADEANYKNLIDVLDEMQICGIGKYVIDKIKPEDLKLIKSYETSKNIPLSITK